MATTIYATEYRCNGNAALDPKACGRFVVLDGGRCDERVAMPEPVDEVVELPDQLPLTFPQRLAVLLAAVAFVAVALLLSTTLSGTEAAAAQSAFDEAPMEQVVVHSGDSLWSIAEEHPVEGVSTDRVVSLIRDGNALDSSELSVGQVLTVPASE